MNLFDIMKTRRSISNFKEKEVSKYLIEDLIEKATYAPSSCNTQPWFYLVFQSKESKNKLKEFIEKGYEYSKNKIKEEKPKTHILFNSILNYFSKYGKFDEAPVYILLFSRPYDVKVFSQAMKIVDDNNIKRLANSSVLTSTILTLQNFQLLAHQEGLGTRIKDGIKFMLGFEKLKNDFYNEFKIPKEYMLVSGIQLGYPTTKALKRRCPPRINKKYTQRFI